MASQSSKVPVTLSGKIRKWLLGSSRDLHDPGLAHKISLVAFLAWVGLGADGLSSSAYGPEEAFRALGHHTYLAIFLVLATTLTVFIISYTYTRIIEQFPVGGGGYVVATKLLGNSAGVVSGSALLVDYILTITVSIAGGGDALFSLLPYEWQVYKLPAECLAIILLTVMNLRGVKESVTAIVPIFMIFIVTHIILIAGSVIFHLADFHGAFTEVHSGFQQGVKEVGVWGLFLIFLRAYSLGGGTYTGIEAVSNGVSILQEPKVKTGKKTMLYMALSLALTAGGLLFCYMLFKIHPVEGQTLNAALARQFAGQFRFAGLPVGAWFVAVTIFSEAVLLLVAAQTGFLDGPRVMANMALDSWLPRRCATLSDRLTMQNGILAIGIAALATLVYTRGHIGLLVVMYSINVFLTFSLSELGMFLYWIRARKDNKKWKANALIFGIGLFLCGAILAVMVIEKFREGAWMTIAITALCIGGCFLIKRHYYRVAKKVREIDRYFLDLPASGSAAQDSEFDSSLPTAVILVGGYSGLGIHILLNIFRLFPASFKNVIFLSVGIINTDFFKTGSHVEELTHKTEETLGRYADFSKKMGIPARFEFNVGTDVVESVSELCVHVSQKMERVVFFAGEIVFENPQWYHKWLHNETAYAIQRKIRFAGLPMVILPIRLRNGETPASKES